MRTVSLMLFVWICAATGASANAAVIVQIGSTVLSPGGTGWVDVMISSDANDLLSEFDFVFLISPEPAVTSHLYFSPTQSDAQLTEPDYVFGPAESGKYQLSLAVGSVTQSFSENDTYKGSDFTLGDNAALSGTPLLLARLNLTHIAPPDPSAAGGDKFRIDLVASDPIDGFVKSAFDDADFEPLLFSSQPGYVTIADTAAVPEPGTLGMFLFSGVGLLWTRRRRRLGTASREGLPHWFAGLASQSK